MPLWGTSADAATNKPKWLPDDANSDYTVAGIPLIVRLNAHFNAGTRRFDSQTTADSTGL